MINKQIHARLKPNCTVNFWFFVPPSDASSKQQQRKNKNKPILAYSLYNSKHFIIFFLCMLKF